MTACRHTPKYPDLASIPSMQEALSHCSLSTDDEKVAKMRGLTSKDGATTKLHKPYWDTLNDAQKAAVLAHERAHPEIGMDVSCEGCADKVGGYLMRAWGYGPDVVQRSFHSLNVQREQDHGTIGANASEGAYAAERALAARGLLGVATSVVEQRLARERLGRAQAVTALESQKATSPTVPVVSGPGNAPALAPEPLPTAFEGGVKAPTGELEPSKPATADTTPVQEAGSDVLGDVVSSVLGEDARPHATKVLIAAGVAAMVAVLLVVIVRK